MSILKHDTNYNTKTDKRLSKLCKQKYSDWVVHKTLGINRGRISKKKLKFIFKKKKDV